MREPTHYLVVGSVIGEFLEAVLNSQKKNVKSIHIEVG
jgi:hypothetical protein